MLQIYKVFVNNFYLLFIDYSHFNNDLIFTQNKEDYKLIQSYQDLIIYLKSKNYILDISVIYVTHNPFKCFQKFKSKFNYILAAGGVVQNESDDILMIYKNNIWDLPKGKVEIDEDPRHTAVRELKEETNVEVKDVSTLSFSTYHIYFLLSEMYLKETKWFLMSPSFKNKLLPQMEEGIEKVTWVNFSKIPQIKIYNSIKEVLHFFFKY